MVQITGTPKNIPSIANPICEIKGDQNFLFPKPNIILPLLKVIVTSLHSCIQGIIKPMDRIYTGRVKNLQSKGQTW
jgi:hypothetical protein